MSFWTKGDPGHLDATELMPDYPWRFVWINLILGTLILAAAASEYFIRRRSRTKQQEPSP